MPNFVFKFKLKITDSQDIHMHRGAKILSAQFQGEDLCLWALCDPQAPQHGRTILLNGTGHQIEERNDKDLEFIATVQDGRFVWHIFEEY